jgi:hypothetical protein
MTAETVVNVHATANYAQSRTYLPEQMVEQVVGSGQQCAPSTSLVRGCSLPVPAELQIDAICQWRDVAAASVAPDGTTALAGVAAEKGVRVCRTLWLVGLAKYFWGHWREGPGWPRADAGGHALSEPTQTWPKFLPRIGQAGRVRSDASHR